MDMSTVLLLMVAVGAISAAVAVEVTRRRSAGSVTTDPAEAVQTAVDAALAEMRAHAGVERDESVRAALEQAVILQREQLGSAALQVREHASAELSSKKDVIDARLDQVHQEMRSELGRIGTMVAALSEASAQKFGQVDQSLRTHAEITEHLSDSARSLREALVSPTARGQWGERMAEDVLRLAGFVENVNYVKQTQVEGGTGRPDFTFPLPKGHELYMDVKFPMAGYLRYLEAPTEAERQAHRTAFLRDVRLRVKELAKRDYARASARATVDYVLLFLPNEQLTGFIHEHDPALLDDALGQRVVMCSPLTLFAFLGVIRQAFDNFMVEQTSDQILGLISKFGQQWIKYNEALDKVKNRFDQLDRSFDELVGPRRRQLEKPLQQLDAVRRERNLPIDGQLFAEIGDEHGDDVGDEHGDGPDNLHVLGA
jgi:DNA recombination protein RmuC